MKQKIVMVCLFLFLSGCITTISPGILFNYTIEHVNTDSNRKLIGSGRIIKRGESCTYNTFALNLIYKSDLMNMEDILRQAGITKIGVVDFISFNILGPIFYVNCIVVWGE